MSSDGVEDLVIISSEKQFLDAISLLAVVDRLDASKRGVPL